MQEPSPPLPVPLDCASLVLSLTQQATVYTRAVPSNPQAPMCLMTRQLSHKSSIGSSPWHLTTCTGSGASQLSSVSQLSHLTSSSEIQPPIQSCWLDKGKQGADPHRKSKRIRFTSDNEDDPHNTLTTTKKRRSTTEGQSHARGRSQKH